MKSTLVTTVNYLRYPLHVLTFQQTRINSNCSIQKKFIQPTEFPKNEDYNRQTARALISIFIYTMLTRYRTLHARMSHRTGATKTCLRNRSQKIKQYFYVSEETKASHVRANVPRYNERLYKSKCIQFNARYETVAI